MLLYEMKEIADLYIDAFVINNEDELLFLSVWGLDTAIHEFLAKLSIPSYEGGLANFHVRLSNSKVRPEDNSSEWYRVKSGSNLEKTTGRATQKDVLFNGLVHLFLYDKLATNIDYANRRCLLLKRQIEDSQQFSQKLWQTVRSVCPVPLLPEWDNLLEEFREIGCIQHFAGIGMDAYQIDFSDSEIENWIATQIQSGKLTLPQPKKASHLSLVK